MTKNENTTNASAATTAQRTVLNNGDVIVQNERGYCLGVRTAPGQFDGWQAFPTFSQAVGASAGISVSAENPETLAAFLAAIE